MIVRKNVSKILYDLRKKSGLSQSQFGAKVGLRKDKVSSYETGRAYPSIEGMINISKTFNLSIEYLIGNSKAPVSLDAIKWAEKIARMPQDEQDKIYMVVDALIRGFKAKN